MRTHIYTVGSSILNFSSFTKIPDTVTSPAPDYTNGDLVYKILPMSKKANIIVTTISDRCNHELTSKLYSKLLQHTKDNHLDERLYFIAVTKNDNLIDRDNAYFFLDELSSMEKKVEPGLAKVINHPILSNGGDDKALYDLIEGIVNDINSLEAKDKSEFIEKKENV